MLQAFQLVADYGAAALILLACIYALFKLIISKSSKKLAKIFSSGEEFPIESIQVSDLRNHPLFSSVEYKINIEIPSIEFNSKQPIKQDMVKDLLILYMQSMRDGCLQLCNRDDLSLASPDKWAAEVNEAFNRMITEFQRKALDMGIPAVVLNKFSRWNASAVRTIHDYIFFICTMNSGTNKEKTSTFFLIINLLLTTCVVDGDKTFRDLTVELQGKIYKGQPLEH